VPAVQAVQTVAKLDSLYKAKWLRKELLILLVSASIRQPGASSPACSQVQVQERAAGPRLVSVSSSPQP
jgi:hypothetical protein